tara:strand:- start:37 stop:435 length:399 start_codon:yes stop_codon:yes gene_type:complete
MTKFKVTPITLAVATIVLSFASANVSAGSLQNLERERAAMIETLLDSGIKNSERQRKIEISRSQLIDLERMVLRDQSLKGKNTRAIQMAFKNYDLTFLVHASIEKGKSVSDHWIGEVGLTTASLMNARMGRR